MPAVRDKLARANQTLEQAYGRLAERFGPLAEKTEELKAAREALATLTSDRAGGRAILEEASEILAKPFDYLFGLLDRHREICALMEQSIDRTAQLARVQKAIDEQLAPLRYIEILIKTEASSTKEDDRATFYAVSAQIAQVRMLVDEKFRANTASLQQIQENFASIHQAFVEGFQSEARRIRKERERIIQGIEHLDQESGQSTQLDERTFTMMETIMQDILAVIATMQTQDLVKQQCDHIDHALEALATCHPGDAAPVHKLVGEHLDLANRTARNGFNDLDGLLHKLSGEIDALDAHSLRQESYDVRIAAADGITQRLLDALGDVEEMVEHSHQLARRSLAAASSAATTLSQLNLALGELSANMHLIALNAQIRSAQISEGTGLGILAARTSVISREITGMGGRVGEDVSALADCTRSLVEIFSEFERAGGQIKETLAGDGASLGQRLHVTRDHVLDFSRLLGQTLGLVRGAVCEAHPVAAQIPQAQTGLDACLRQVRTHLPPPARRRARGPRARRRRQSAVLESIPQVYSMASERNVHARVSGKKETAAGLDIELF
ncbi:MAG: hypothetical protein ACLFR7_12025 [Opitutales bacterium]